MYDIENYYNSYIYISKLFDNFLKLKLKNSNEYYEKYINTMFKQMYNDLNIIKKYYKNKNIELMISYIKLYFFSYFGIGEKSFFKNLEISNNLNIIKDDLNECLNNFRVYNEEDTQRIIQIFQNYYEIVLVYGEEADFKEIYAFYQTVLTIILYNLPQNFRNDLLEKNFKNLKEELYLFDYETSLAKYNINLLSFGKIETYIKNYIEKKYSADVYSCRILNKKRI